MLSTPSTSSSLAEEHLVAELEQLGICYLSRQSAYQAQQVRPPHQLLADLVRQPSSRVRTALIAVLLAHPAFGNVVPSTLPALTSAEQSILKILYTAAVLLQKKYAPRLRAFIGEDWIWIPDWFSKELNLPAAPPNEQLRALALLHQQATGLELNWVGTYNNVARHLLHRWELERLWNQ